jgi:uncharacterized protein YkwD
MRRALGSAAAAAALLAAAACATPAPDARGGAALPAPSTPAAPAPVRPPPAQGSYGPEPELALAPVEVDALELAEKRFGGAGGRPRASTALSIAARELAARAADGEVEMPSGPAVRAALARSLAWDAAPRLYRISAPPGGVEAALAPLLRAAPATHIGAGAVERDGVVHLVLLASERKARLDPFPREVPLAAGIALSGELSRGLHAPRVAVTSPSGEVTEPEVTARGGAFRANLAFPARGVYAVEVLARGDGGPEVVALLTVAAGGARIEIPPRSPAAAREPADLGAAEAQVVRAINATRGRHGLPPLEGDAAIAAVARRHSEAMRAAGRIAHVLPGSGELGERLRRAGVPYRLASENVASAATALAAHEQIEGSPAHLANVLRGPARKVGVGFVRGRAPSGAEVVYLTEIFVEPAGDLGQGPLTPDAQVREALWRERARLGQPPLTADVALEQLAREAAASMRARDATDADGVEERALAAGRRLAAVDVFVGSRPDDATRSTNLGDARFHRVGVGVATGDSARYGAQRLWIAVLYTD